MTDRHSRFKHFTVVIEGLTVHFVHEKSADADAIPVILLHGWPGTLIHALASTHDVVELTRL